MKLTKEQLFFKKVKEDERWYCKSFLKIRNKNSKLVPFVINEAQEQVMEIIDDLRKQRKPIRLIILKARQMGISTLTEGLIFQNTSTNQFVNSMIIAHEDRATQNLFNMSKLYYDELPSVIKPMKKYSNGKELTFENPGTDEMDRTNNPGLRSKITVHTANTVEAGRSSTIHNLHASEVAFFPNAKTTMLGLLQCVPDTPETMVILESTANGVGDYFHDLWNKSVRGENDFVPVFLPWFTDSTYTRPFSSEEQKKAFIETVEQINTTYDGKKVHTEEYELMKKFDLTYEQLFWRKWAIQNKCGGDEEGFRQEYPSTPEEAFIATGRPRFNIPSLRAYGTQTKEPKMRGYLRWVEHGKTVKFEEDDKGYVRIWKEPTKGYYGIGADVAEGLIDGDYSSATVGDDNFDICASWYGHIDPDLYGEELVKLAIFYNQAYLGVEANNHGLTTLKSIQRLEYWNIFYQKSYDKIADKLTSKMGWTTSIRTKPLMIDKLAEFVREKYLGIPWDILVGELTTYVIEDNGSTNAQTGCYDDTVMATAILLQVLLEGRGENYIPEKPIEGGVKMNKDVDIIDPLFEKESKFEVCT